VRLWGGCDGECAKRRKERNSNKHEADLDLICILNNGCVIRSISVREFYNFLLEFCKTNLKNLTKKSIFKRKKTKKNLCSNKSSKTIKHVCAVLCS
jgi:hypothetical protein